MSNTTAARAKAWGRISQLLAGVAAPHTFQIEPGGLQRIPGARAIAYWFEGESEKGKTVGGNVMVTHKIGIRAFWRIPSTDDARARTALELEIWDTTRAIQGAVHADSDLAGTVTRVDFGLAQRGIEPVTVGTGVEAVEMMTLDLPLYLQELEAEGITA